MKRLMLVGLALLMLVVVVYADQVQVPAPFGKAKVSQETQGDKVYTKEVIEAREALRVIIEGSFKDPEILKEWTEGVKQQYSLELKELKIVVKSNLLAEEEGYYIFETVITISAYCLDSTGMHKRVVKQIFVYFAVQKGTNIVLGSQMINATDNEVIDGWDEKDI